MPRIVVRRNADRQELRKRDPREVTQVGVARVNRPLPPNSVPAGTPLIPEADITLEEVYTARPELRAGAVPSPTAPPLPDAGNTEPDTGE